METITFYSYKGGVGRTLALANIAMYLSRFGQNVCIMDFDLEAPGLHYKFPRIVATADIKKGLVDYIYEFIHEKQILNSLNELTITLFSSSKSQGEIRLIPAGNVLSPDYWRKLASIDWHALFYEENSEGVPFFLELKERIREEIKPDFLLIDSRTGITEMSGLCTSLLPDKVVFLIVNNRENMEGARQILQSIQKVERFPGQEPIKVVFALTRIPFPEEEKGERVEKEILKKIEKFLNEPVENLKDQLNIQEICILHSDRELELSESLRISFERIPEEMPLSRDYLRLFSRIIPEKIILPKLDSILDENTTSEKLLEDPDKVQQELEGIVASYPHSRSLEKLIEVYIVRNVAREKLLPVFHKLWETFGIDNTKILSKYVSLFMTEDERWRRPKYELEIVEKYLELDPKDKVEVEARLADAYMEYGNLGIALKHYYTILDKVENKNRVIGRILHILIETGTYEDALNLFEKYSDIIDSDRFLRVQKLEILCKVGKIEEAKKLLDDGGITENTLLEKNPRLYFSIMKEIGKIEKAEKNLERTLERALERGDPEPLFEVGKIFYALKREDEFRLRVEREFPGYREILRQLEREYRYRKYEREYYI